MYKPKERTYNRPMHEIDGVNFPIHIERMGWYKQTKPIHSTMKGAAYKHHFIDVNGVSACGKVIFGIDPLERIDDSPPSGECCQVCLKRVQRREAKVKKMLFGSFDREIFKNDKEIQKCL